MNISIKRQRFIGNCVLLASLLLVGCTGVTTPTPASTQEKSALSAITKSATHKHYSGKFVWHDLLTDDVSGAKAFYSALFGWTFEEEGAYITIYNRGKLIGGMMEVSSKSGNIGESVWLPSMSVKNVDSAISEVKANKGRVLKGPLDMPKRGRGVLVSDAQGAHIVLLQAKGGDPMDATPQMGDWLWNELWTSKPKESETLYRALGKYQVVSNAREYRILKNKGKWRAGIRDVSKEDAKSRWASVIRIADLQKTMDQVVRLGGKILMKPRKEIADGNVAVIADSTGALLIMQRWSDTVAQGGK